MCAAAVSAVAAICGVVSLVLDPGRIVMWTITYFGLMSTCGMLYTLYMDQKARRLVASEQADLSH